jgi:hypothetical protein
MNIFYFSNDPKICAQWHIDKHVVKMIVEYAQLMSTAHRILDGQQYQGKTRLDRNIQRWLLPDEREDKVYKASHVKHPSGLWLRQSNNNYNWLYCLFCELADEYQYRYGRVHKTYDELKGVLKTPPNNINTGYFTQPPPAMPDEYKVSADSKVCYKAYYNGAKRNFAKWTKREVPEWFNKEIA